MCDLDACGHNSGSLELGALAGILASKPGRRVMFWGFAVPVLPFAVVGVLGWWTIALAAVLAVAAAAGALLVRRLHHQHTLIVAPPSLRKRVALPAPVVKRARALRALPAPQRAIASHPVSDRHKANPVTFRPPEDDRAWLYAHAKATGRPAGSILSDALAAYREAIEAPAVTLAGVVLPAAGEKVVR